MIFHLSEYEAVVQKVFEKTPVIKTEQLILFLTKTFAISDAELPLKILHALQRNGTLFLSKDGWTVSKPFGEWAFASSRCSDNDGNGLGEIEPVLRLGQIQSLRNIWDITDCFWLLLDSLPDSMDFVIPQVPWSLAFYLKTPDETVKLCELVRIRSGEEFIKGELLKCLPKIENREAREGIMRIAVMDDETRIWTVPHIGFTHICKLDDENGHHYRVIEKRAQEEVWAEDYLR